MTEHLPIARPGRTRRAPLRGRRGRKPRHRYFAFLSYSHKDEELAEWLHAELERFRVPSQLVGKISEHGVIPRRLTPVFRDRQELGAASDLGEEIEEALAGSQFLIVLCSPHAAASRWTNAEIAAFKKRRPDGCVLAAIAGGEPFASEIEGREDQECFPPALRQRYDRLGRATGKRAEPLAADLREEQGGRRVGFLRLVAGMLGVGLDELVQRETTRRQRRLGFVASASLAGMALTSLLALTAIQARDEARDQRREAEGLVAFMLGDLKDKLEPIGKLDALDGVGARVLDYYRDQDASELSDAGLMQRSQALSLSAQVAFQRGDFESAKKLFEEAMKGTDEAISRDPDDPQRLFDHAQNVFYAAQIDAQAGRTTEAERGLRDYQALALRMTALDPDNLKWRMEVQYSEANLGFVLLSLRRYNEAAAQFAKALRTIEAVSALDPGNTGYQISKAETLAWLADAEIARGNLPAAVGARQRQVALLLQLKGQSDNVQWREKLIPAHKELGRMLVTSGRYEQGLDQLSASVQTAKELLPAEPNNSIWLNYSAAAQFALAGFHADQGDLQSAARELKLGCAQALRLGRSNRLAIETRIALWTCQYQRGALSLLQGNSGAALSHAGEAAALASGFGESQVVKSYYLARSMMLLGDAAQRGGNGVRAAAAWQRALSLLSSGSQPPWEMAVRAELLERVGRTADARTIDDSLRRNGFVNVNVLRS